MDYITDVESTHKCAYDQCQCQISSTLTYCSAYCTDADDVEETEIECNCEHPPCVLD